MKIICKDNYDRETVSDSLVAENLSGYYAELIARLLNQHFGEESQGFFEAVPDYHKLHTFEP